MINELENLARAATPQDFDSAAEKAEGGFVECPACGGEGAVELEADYCNYDGTAIGVHFYGIGKEFRSAESYYRAANPATMLKLIKVIRAQQYALEAIAEAEWDASAKLLRNIANAALANELGVK
jgi:hypothetical protein